MKVQSPIKKKEYKNKIPKSYYSMYPQITFSSKTFQNEFYNNYMEDIIYTNPLFNGGHHKSLFCVFDGHGGDKSAKISSEKIPTNFLKYLKEKPKDIEQNLLKSFKVTDNLLKNENCFEQGNKATIVYLEYNNLYCANVGDSSCVLISNYKGEKISFDDKCTNILEKNRIEKLGNHIFSNRLEGILTLSRALGDHNLKQSGLISIPHINKFILNHCHKFCIIASDGVWDVIDENLVYEFSRYTNNADELCNIIVDEAINRGTRDNISCIVIGFNWKY